MKRRVTFGALVVMCSLVFAFPIFAQSQARIVRLSYLSGSVDIDRSAGQGFERAIMNMPVTQGTRVRTHDGQAEVEFENGSTVRLTPETLVSFDSLSLRDNGDKINSISIQQGVAYFNLTRKNDNDFKLQLAGRDIEPKKSAHFRVETSANQIRLAVFNGELNVLGLGARTMVHKNQTFSFDPNDASRYALAKNIDEYQFDSWDRQRDQYQSQYARNGYAGGRGAPHYGVDDLNYYGAFSYFPGYGNMWRPYGVGYGWDPFSTGYWVWYPTFGYTWVSPYAWGWLPYRYGGWHFLPGYGWHWRPGGWNQGWHPVTPVVNPPTTFVPPRPPAISHGGVIGVGNTPAPGPAPRWNRLPDNDGNNRFGGRHRVAPLPTPNITSPVAVDVPRNNPGRRSETGTASPHANPRVMPAGPERRGTAAPPPRSAPPSVTPRSVDRGTSGGSRSMGGTGSASGGGRSMGGSGSTPQGGGAQRSSGSSGSGVRR